MKKIASPFRLTDTVTLRNRLTSGGGQQACTQGPEEFPTDNAIDEAISVASASASIVCFTHYGIFGRGAATGSQEGMNWENERVHFQNYDFDDPKIMNLITHCSQLTHMYGAKAIFRLGASGVAWLKVRSYRGGDKSAFPIPTERIANFCDHLTFSSLSPTALIMQKH